MPHLHVPAAQLLQHPQRHRVLGGQHLRAARHGGDRVTHYQLTSFYALHSGQSPIHLMRIKPTAKLCYRFSPSPPAPPPSESGAARAAQSAAAARRRLRRWLTYPEGPKWRPAVPLGRPQKRRPPSGGMRPRLWAPGGAAQQRSAAGRPRRGAEPAGAASWAARSRCPG